MASHFLLAQQIFSEIYKQAGLDAAPTGGVGVTPTDVRCVDVNGTYVPNINVSSPNAFAVPGLGPSTPDLSSSLPKDLPSLILFFFSFSALREWLKLLVAGSVLEMLRRLLFYTYRKVCESFIITAMFEDDDPSYEWICYWLSRQPTWRNARDIQVSTQSFGLGTTAVMIEGEDDSDPSSLVQGGRPLAFLPAQDLVHTMWYKGHWMRVTRYTKEGYYGRRDHFLELKILTRRHDTLNQLLIEAKRAHTQAKENAIGIYVSDSTNAWRHIASRPKRPLNSIILDPGMKDLLIDDAKDFLASKAWYAARGIPFRRGYLLYGAPGSGKTSLIHSLAGELGLDVYIISLSRIGLDDTALSELISELPEKCIALMEDIDAAFSQTLNRNGGSKSADNADDLDDEDKEKEDQKPKKGGPTLHPDNGNSNQDPPNMSNPMQGRPMSRITLSGLLNALDGVAAQEGRILFATTNKYDSLDPALCRPGRMDIHMEFKLASQHQAREMFKCFYLPDKADEKEDKVDNEEGGDSGYSSDFDEKAGLIPKKESLGSDLHQMRLRRTGKLSIEKIQVLADEFADGIPEREFSMASLQGYLMGYKVRPIDAVQDIRKWVEKGRKEAGKRK